ncbi:MAG TPA: hypothetical protein DGB32_05375 [Dehalococcoidia bacterium]|nr:hypothetical protein [Dehalococcoidia bacterium]
MKGIHEDWWDLQKSMFDPAYDIAARGRAMIDVGERKVATELLTRYMANNAENMLRVGREMLCAGVARAR